MNQQQLAAVVRQVSEQQKKTITEIRGLQDEVTTLQQQIVDLKDKLTNGATSDELASAVEELKTQAQAVDDAIPDAPVIPQLPNMPVDPNAPREPVIPGMPPDGTKAGPNSPVKPAPVAEPTPPAEPLASVHPVPPVTDPLLARSRATTVRRT